MKIYGPILFVTVLALVTPARAHPLPKSADPMPNAVLTASPTKIRIGFSESLVAVFSGIELDDASGKKLTSIGPSRIDPNDDRVLTASIPTKLAPGTYSVKWYAVGNDTHRVAGHYVFRMK